MNESHSSHIISLKSCANVHTTRVSQVSQQQKTPRCQSLTCTLLALGLCVAFPIRGAMGLWDVGAVNRKLSWAREPVQEVHNLSFPITQLSLLPVTVSCKSTDTMGTSVYIQCDSDTEIQHRPWALSLSKSLIPIVHEADLFRFDHSNLN